MRLRNQSLHSPPALTIMRSCRTKLPFLRTVARAWTGGVGVNMVGGRGTRHQQAHLVVVLSHLLHDALYLS